MNCELLSQEISQNAFGERYNLLGDVLGGGRLGASGEPLGASLGALWSVLGVSWRLLGGSWDP